MYLFELVFLFSLDKYPGVKLLDHMVLFLVFCRVSLLFSTVAASIYIPTNTVQGLPKVNENERILNQQNPGGGTYLSGAWLT